MPDRNGVEAALKKAQLAQVAMGEFHRQFMAACIKHDWPAAETARIALMASCESVLDATFEAYRECA